MAITLHDAHCHFLSSRFFETLGREKYGADLSSAAARMVEELGWEAPGTTDALAARWIAELDQSHVSRVGLIASIPGDEESVAAAVGRYPTRFVGFFVLNPTAPDAEERARRGSTDLACGASAFFPRCIATGWTTSGSQSCSRSRPHHGGAIFAHCGYLSLEARAQARPAEPPSTCASAIRLPCAVPPLAIRQCRSSCRTSAAASFARR